MRLRTRFLARWAQQIAVAQIFAAAALMAGDAPRSASSEQLLRLGNVVEIHLQIARDGWESLRNDQRGYVRASLSEGGQTYGEVGLRLKGSAGSFRPVDSEKPGFTIKVNQFVRGQRFHGLRKFLLNNAVQDPTYVSESVGNELFRAAGVPAARSCHARVYLNERDLGLYVLFEAISRDFLALNFTNPDGNIYEGPGDVSGEIVGDTHGPFLEREDLMMLTHAAEEPHLRERYRRLEEVLDVDRFVTFLVLEALLWHWDGYGVGVNNYRIYSDPSQGRLVFLPHGCDQLLQDPRGSIAPPLQGLVARAFLGTPEGQRLYRKRLGEILDKVFLVERIRPRIQILIAALRPVFASRSPAEADEFEGSAAGFLGRLEERRRSALEQIDDPAGAFGAPLEFDEEGIARPAGWRTKIDQGAAVLSSQAEDSPEAEEVALEPGDGPPSRGRFLAVAFPGDEGGEASFRTSVLLRPGRYRLSGRLRTQGVRPLPEQGTNSHPSGACFRISKHQPRVKVLGDAEWREFQYDFRVSENGPEDEVTAAEARAEEPLTAQLQEAEEGKVESEQLFVVQLICELRASAGRACFDTASVRLVRR